VVGKTPTIKPNGVFSYSSFCPLKTPIGSMEGSYIMVNEEGEEFSVKIPVFRLIASQVLN
jgi:ApaG protein